MRHILHPHPSSASAAVAEIAVEVTRSAFGRLTLRYAVRGTLEGLRLPPPTRPTRTDKLWQETCFEAFVRAPQSSAYYELNFSPSTAWAAYRFSGYRRDMAVAQEIGDPEIAVRSGNGFLELSASLDLGGVSTLSGDTDWSLGLSAVIEETDGAKSYWALAHPPGDPDFHHSDCFVIRLPAA